MNTRTHESPFPKTEKHMKPWKISQPLNSAEKSTRKWIKFSNTDHIMGFRRGIRNCSFGRGILLVGFPPWNLSWLLLLRVPR
ncbi:hypothetical protein EUGRSUZ_C03971 [Eucalyptus grandis]|uniref:Uncharacterized protein n=2 Tax=Eucalyptus grandis TaxID=71139 RepID=A0A059CWN0_EUCGR|nr:hypothetical protein EUGRSUZ_C03971 [Eucalyptus grandis]